MSDASAQPGLPMFGSMMASVQRSQTISIHGDLYHDTTLVPDDRVQAITVRIAAHLCIRPPMTGDRLTLSFLMGQVTGVGFA